MTPGNPSVGTATMTLRRAECRRRPHRSSGTPTTPATAAEAASPIAALTLPLRSSPALTSEKSRDCCLLGGGSPDRRSSRSSSGGIDDRCVVLAPRLGRRGPRDGSRRSSRRRHGRRRTRLRSGAFSALRGPQFTLELQDRRTAPSPTPVPDRSTVPPTTAANRAGPASPPPEPSPRSEPRPSRTGRPRHRPAPGWPSPIAPTVANAPPPDSSSASGITDTVRSVAARSGAVPVKLRSCDTCCTEPPAAPATARLPATHRRSPRRPPRLRPNSVHDAPPGPALRLNASSVRAAS